MATIRILTIDDEKQIRKLLKIGLEAEGFEVTDAANAADGVDRVANVGNVPHGKLQCAEAPIERDQKQFARPNLAAVFQL